LELEYHIDMSLSFIHIHKSAKPRHGAEHHHDYNYDGKLNQIPLINRNVFNTTKSYLKSITSLLNVKIDAINENQLFVKSLNKYF